MRTKKTQSKTTTNKIIIMNLKKILFVVLILNSITTFSQKSATIKVTHLPANTMVEGKSVFVAENYIRVATTSLNCFNFLDVKVYVKASGYKDKPYKYSVEITNNSSFEVDINCSSWGLGGNGGRSGIKPGKTSKSGSLSNGYLSITISKVNFSFSSSDQQKYGVSYLSNYLNCNETPNSYLATFTKIKDKKETEVKRIEKEKRGKIAEDTIIEQQKLDKTTEEIANKDTNRITTQISGKEDNLKKKTLEKQREIKVKEAEEKAANERRIIENELKKRQKINEENNEKIAKATAEVATDIFTGLSNGDISYLSLGIGMRTIEGPDDYDSFSLISLYNTTYELGLSFGSAGFFMGFGLPDSNYDESSGFSWVTGVEYVIYQIEDNYFQLALNAEFGMGDLDETEYGNVRIHSTEEGMFYSLGAKVRVLKAFYISYGYGFFNRESKKTYSDNRSDRVKEGTGNYSKVGLGITFSF